MSNQEFAKIWAGKRQYQYHPQLLCAQPAEADVASNMWTTRGDSGAPLVCQRGRFLEEGGRGYYNPPRVVGLFKWGMTGDPTKRIEGASDYYQDITSFQPWIEDTKAKRWPESG